MKSKNSKLQYVIVYAHDKDNEDKVLLVLKDRPEYLKGRLNLVGGKIELGETVLDAAVRELAEEAGLDATGIPIIQGVVNGGICDIYCVSVPVDYEKPVQPRPGETEVVGWYDWEKVRFDKRIMPNLKVIVPAVRATLAGEKGGGWKIEDVESSINAGNYHTIRLIECDGNEYDVKISMTSEEVMFVGKEYDGEVQGR